MIENELLLLGLLRQGPKHGYEIKKEIKKMLFLFAGIDMKSIYYPLKIMERERLVTQRVRKHLKRPKRLVYDLTNKGENRFQELLKKSLLDLKRPQFSLDLTLYFLNYLKPPVAKRRLRARLFVLDRLINDLKNTVDSLKIKESPSLFHILLHNLRMAQAEAEFLSYFIRTF